MAFRVWDRDYSAVLLRKADPVAQPKLYVIAKSKVRAVVVQRAREVMLVSMHGT